MIWKLKKIKKERKDVELMRTFLLSIVG